MIKDGYVVMSLVALISSRKPQINNQDGYLVVGTGQVREVAVRCLSKPLYTLLWMEQPQLWL